MSVPLYQVDAFTRLPFAGNPAGVAYLAEERSPAWMQALGVKSIFTGKNEFDYLVEVENEAIVRNLQPDITRLGELPVRGVIVTARGTSGEFDFVSRSKNQPHEAKE